MYLYLNLILELHANIQNPQGIHDAYVVILHTQEQDDVKNFGIDWNGPITEDEDDNQVDVPEVENPLLDRDLQLLQATISPTAQSDCFGVDLYLQVVEFVNQIVNN